MPEGRTAMPRHRRDLVVCVSWSCLAAAMLVASAVWVVLRAQWLRVGPGVDLLVTVVVVGSVAGAMGTLIAMLYRANRGRDQLAATALSYRTGLSAAVEAVRRGGEPSSRPAAPVVREWPEAGVIAAALESLWGQAMSSEGEAAAARTEAMIERVGARGQYLGYQTLVQTLCQRLAVHVRILLDCIEDASNTQSGKIPPADHAALLGADQRATRIQRDIENLIILSGGELPEPHAGPVHLGNVVLDAAGEAGATERVRPVEFAAPVAVHLDCAATVAHLLSLVIDNAARYSAGPVEVRTAGTTRGATVEVLDRGLGISPRDLIGLQRCLTEPAAVVTGAGIDSPLERGQTGLIVAGYLARRLGAQVTLSCPPGGTVATVHLPARILTEPARLGTQVREMTGRPPQSRAPQHARPVTRVVQAPPTTPDGPPAAAISAPLPRREPGSHLAAPLAAASPTGPIRAAADTDLDPEDLAEIFTDELFEE